MPADGCLDSPILVRRVVEAREQVDGGSGVVVDPAVVDAFDREGGEREAALAADLLPGHESGVFQHPSAHGRRESLEDPIVVRTGLLTPRM